MADVLVRDAATGIINEFGFSTPVIVILAFVGLYSASNYISWLTVRSMYSQYQDELKDFDAVTQTRLEQVASSIALIAANAALSCVSGARDVGDAFVSNFPNLVKVFLVAGAMTLVVTNHQMIFESARRFYQCEALDLAEPYLHILNFLRLLANSLIPIADVIIEFMARLSPTDILLRTLRKCAAETDFFLLLDSIAEIFSELGISIYTYFTGDFLTDRLEFFLVAEKIGNIANALIPVAECYCNFLLPVFMFVLTALQDPDLHHAIDAAVNVIIRAVQIPLAGLINFEVPTFHHLAVEINCLLIHAGDWIGTDVRGVVDMLSAIISTIISMTSTVALARSMGKKPIIPANLEAGSITDADILAQAGQVEPATFSEILHAKYQTWASLLSDVAPGEETVLPIHTATPIWQIPPNSTLNGTIGFARLYLLFYAPWPRVATQTAAAAVSLANQTLNIITHSYNFTNPDALSYFQFGPVFDHLRDAVRAAASLTIIFADEVPAWVETLGDVYLTLIEAITELVPGWIFAIIFLCWRPGDNPLGNCNKPPDIVPCDCNTNPSQCNWSPTNVCNSTEFFDIFNFFPAYADWTGSALQTAIRYGDANANAMAIMLNCNQTEIDDSNCTAKPFQCMLRTATLAALEIVNQTHRVLFYIPDIVRFDHTKYHTMQDVGLEPIMDYFLLFADCFSQWYAISFYLFLYLFSDEPKTETYAIKTRQKDPHYTLRLRTIHLHGDQRMTILSGS
jgi:hypothetical protein